MSDNIWLDIDNYWQELREGILWSTNDILRNISRWTKDEQIGYLQERVDDLSGEIGKIHKGYMNLTEKDTNILTKKIFLLMAGLKKREKLLKGIRFSLRLLEYPDEIREGEISPAMIARAREYPLRELVKANKFGMAHSPFRDDRHPSFYVKKNFFYDFANGESGDVISFAMRLYSMNFVEAVKRLSGSSIDDKKVTSKKQFAAKEKVLWGLIERRI